jgi:hypothetical protein
MAGTPPRYSEWWWLVVAAAAPALVLYSHIGFFRWLNSSIPIELAHRQALRGQIILFSVAGLLAGVVVLGIVQTQGRARIMYLVVSIAAGVAAFVSAYSLITP